MKERKLFGFTARMEREIQKTALAKVFFNLAAAFTGGYCGLFIVLTIAAMDDYDVEDFINYGGDLGYLCGVIIGSLIVMIVLAIVGDSLAKNGKGIAAAAVYGGFINVMLLPIFTLLSDVYDEDEILCQFISVFVLIAVIIFVIIGIAKTASRQRSLGIIIANLKKSRFEIKDDKIVGIYFNEIRRPGDGQYIELPLSQIRQVRTAWFNAETQCYYTLMIDHAMGTLNFSIDYENSAAGQLRVAMNPDSAPPAPPVVLPVTGNEPSATVPVPAWNAEPESSVKPKEPSVAPMPVVAPPSIENLPKQWKCKTCGNYVSTDFCSNCGTRQESPFEKIETLKNWLQKGLITQAEYDKKVSELYR